jgi:hypothetical protein
VGIESLDNWSSNVNHSGNTFVGCTGGNVWIEYTDEILNDLP